MGGEKETTLAKSNGNKTEFDGFRIHESNGEIHIHDDKKKLKIAIPVAKAWKIWDRISEVGETKFFDPVNKTVLIVETKIENYVMDVTLSIIAVKFGNNYEKLNGFFKRG